MTVPSFLHDILGWRKKLPNTADKGSKTSIKIAAAILDLLGIKAPTTLTGQTAGTRLEQGVADMLKTSLPALSSVRSWLIDAHPPVTAFDQYAHIADLDELIAQDHTGILRTVIGSEYLIKPDVAVSFEQDDPSRLPFLHATVSCKWTIRSDRVQNIRHEAVLLTRLRRGRQPHIVAVTAEPLPTRLAAIARGTGEVDAVYHATFGPLKEATEKAGTAEQQEALDELIEQRRLFDLADLPKTLARY